MKLVAVEMSRLTALYHATRKAGQLYLPEAVRALVGRYKFAGAPNSYEELTGERIDLKHGEFEGNAIDSFEIYNDGIIVASRSDTDFIDHFFSDFTAWMADELGLSMIKTHSIDRIYDSNLVVETDKEILKPLNTLSQISEMVCGELEKTSGLRVEFQPFGFELAADQTQNAFLKPIAFRIERRLGTEFSLNQFRTSAPLKTKQHLAVLEKLEALV